MDLALAGFYAVEAGFDEITRLSRFWAMRRTASLADSRFGDFAMRSFPPCFFGSMMADHLLER